ncbi:GTP 3',8-cyclase MoaA [Leucothrix arctica]|uniref:GTP 3',8-cyclase n=1 Tax=Leucothrix arctica TaxID=1481894 RepID=A0A317CCT6_9GAMM|nr:GTP 3',8-cyclase MoaA [Leucothrix arctica]PWQ95931.1 GTP 3',8-cyclase MoaA [Leucothrix arctica]
MSELAPPTTLVDKFGRQINYLRISVTDRCDLRCVYCMSEDMQFMPRAKLLTLEEIARIAQQYVDMGVTKIRITGGEPLTRRNVMKLFNDLGAMEGLEDLTVTTNGTLLTKYAAELKSAGVTRINVSLDTLQADRFKAITRIGDIQKTLDGIDAALTQGFKSVKINAVIMKNHNDDEILDLIEYVRERDMDISFIEEMPLGDMGEHDRDKSYCSSDLVQKTIEERYPLMATPEKTGGPSRYFRMNESLSRIGFISPHSHNFCDDCNRVRLTAEGRLLLCLGQEHSVDFRAVVRANPTDDTALRKAIIGSLAIKPKGHDFDVTVKPIIMRHMSATGG